MPRQQSIHRLPKWEQEPQVDGVGLCDGFNGRPLHVHPIGVQEHHCTMGTPVSLTTPLLETSIGVIMNNRDLLGAVREVLSQSLQFDDTLSPLLDEEVMIKRWLGCQGNSGTPLLP
jgi:hypothetical protein